MNTLNTHTTSEKQMLHSGYGERDGRYHRLEWTENRRGKIFGVIAEKTRRVGDFTIRASGRGVVSNHQDLSAVPR